MNKDVKHRDEIIFGDYNEKRYWPGGCANFEAPAEKIKQLIDEGFLELDENQNDSPTTKEFMDIITGYEDWIEFEAYAISQERDDYRVTIEGINIWVPAENRDALCNFIEQFRYADEFNIHTDENGYHLRAWWD